jgi:hypothetical protein
VEKRESVVRSVRRSARFIQQTEAADQRAIGSVFAEETVTPPPLRRIRKPKTGGESNKENRAPVRQLSPSVEEDMENGLRHMALSSVDANSDGPRRRQKRRESGHKGGKRPGEGQLSRITGESLEDSFPVFSPPAGTGAQSGGENVAGRTFAAEAETTGRLDTSKDVNTVHHEEGQILLLTR